MRLTEHQMRFFETFGFLKFPGLFAGEADAITEAFEQVWAESGKEHDFKQRSMIVPFVDQNEYLCSLMDDPRIEDVVSSVLGDDFNYASSDGNYYVGDTNWHSDKPIDDKYQALKVAFYLDPVTRDTGCLRVLPGSCHPGDRFSAALHEAVPVTGQSHPEEFWGIDGSEVPAYAIESIPGDLLMFNHKTKHSSWGGGDRRRMFTMNFEERYPEDGLQEMLDKIAHVATVYGRADVYGETMVRTAGPARMRHLEQRLANADHLPALAAKAREETGDPTGSQWRYKM